MAALRNHYSGEGNTSRRIAAAEKLRDTLHYRNERSLPFSTFLDRLQKMFNIFEEEKEEISEPAKVRMLLQKVQHPQLQAAVDALKVRSSIDGISFTLCANHLSAQVSELPDPQISRKVATIKNIKKGNGIKRNGEKNGGKRNGIHMPDGSVWTGFYSDWDQLSKEDKQTVIDTRVSNKAKGGRGKKVAGVLTTGDKKALKEITSQVSDLKRRLASLKMSKTDSTDIDSDEDDAVPDNAGDAFGGRIKKKKAKVAAHVSSIRRQITRKLSRVRTDVIVHNHMELDSHADTAVLGRNCTILNYTGRECDVSPYTDSYEAIKNVPIVTGATAWTSQTTGETYILVINEALWMGDVLDNSLLNPNQLCHHGVKVQDNPYDDTELHLATEDGDFIFPLQATGTIISLTHTHPHGSRTPNMPAYHSNF
jgi:hypothetical protein